MNKRRTQGEGSIFRQGNSWVVFLELPRRPNGKRHRKKRQAKTKAEALRVLKQMRAEIDEVGPDRAFDKRSISETLADYNNSRRGKRAKSTTDSGERFSEVILEYFGPSLKTKELTVRSCDALFAAFVAGEITPSAQPVSRSYGKELRGYLVGALRNDQRQGFISRNPAEVAIVPLSNVESRSMRALSISEWQQLHNAASGATKLAVDLSGRHGLRPQEARSVLWTELDLNKLTISVTTQFDSFDELRGTKTPKSNRTIPLHKQTAEALSHWETRQHRMRETAGNRWHQSELVLTTRWGTPINRNNHLRSIANACVKAGIEPVVPYELRHTAITHQIEAGHPASRVADWAGTSEEMIFRHYRHKLRELTDLDPPDYD